MLHEVMAVQGAQASWQALRMSGQFRLQTQAGHKVWTPSQVTEPRWLMQLLFVAVQVVFPWQLKVVPFWQIAVALQSAFSPTDGGFAASVGAGVAR